MAGSVAALILLAAGTARAGDDFWGGVECGQVPYAGCDLGAGQAPSPPTQPDPDSSPRAPQGGQGSDASLVRCSYVRTDYRTPPGGTVTISHEPNQSGTGAVRVVHALFRSDQMGGTRFAQQPGEAGAWYVYRCSGSDFMDAFFRAPVWIPDSAGPDGAAGVSPAQLAARAYSRLRLPSPAIRSNPVGPQLVNLPTWLWVDQASWGPRSATVSVPGVSVTATATPARVVWSMGDGADVRCMSAGTPFPAGADPAASSPDCGHTYHASSQGRPGNSFAVEATVFWDVRWAGAGQGGTFDGLSTTSTATFTVVESQAVNTN